MAHELALWLYGTRVAIVDQQRGRLRLRYTEEAIDQYPLGSPLLSISLPLTPERYPHGAVRPFLDGLLPEGEARAVIASDFNVPRDDTYRLIAAIGRDCAGALVIQPAEDPPPATPTTLTAEPVTDEEIVQLVGNLRSAPLGAGGRVRISLAGVQEKLLLTRMTNGSWGRPVDGTPSTHILKPEIAQFPDTVENEAFCMRFARHLGLPVADVDTMAVTGRRVIVVKRYDRKISDDGAVQRIHQEDLWQAMGMLPDRKYEENGGPSLRRVAALLQGVATPDSLELLLRATTMNVLIGNSDAHGKNFSLLHEASGALRLAPLYDLVSTLVYGMNRLAMYVDTVQRLERVTADRIVNEATHWGMPRQFATDIVGDILDRAPRAAEDAREQTDGLPPDVLATVDVQLTRLRGQRTG